MSRVRFSIVIPTRERANTLQYTLRSCLMQSFEDYEVVVCDNCSSPATRDVVDSFASTRIKYVRAAAPLAMSDNWELALSHAEGEFVTVLGDDDALLLHALTEASRLIDASDARAIRWAWMFYNWPDHPLPTQRHCIHIPLGSECYLVRSDDVIRRVKSNAAAYSQLPMIYNSFIRRDLISELRARTGRIFNDMIPDVYSGFAFASLATKYLSVARPMAIAGQSGKSNGQATLFCKSGNEVAEEFCEFNAKAGLAWNSRVPHVTQSISATAAQSFEQFTANCGRSNPPVFRERKSLAEAILLDLKRHPHLSDVEFSRCFDIICEWCSDDPALRAWLVSRYGVRGELVTRSPDGVPVRGFNGSWFIIDGSTHNIRDTVAAAEFFESMFGGCGRPIHTGDAERHKASRLKQIVREVLPPVVVRAIQSTIALTTKVFV